MCHLMILSHSEQLVSKSQAKWPKDEAAAHWKRYSALLEKRSKELDASSEALEKFETHKNVGHGWIWFWKRKAG